MKVTISGPSSECTNWDYKYMWFNACESSKGKHCPASEWSEVKYGKVSIKFSFFYQSWIINLSFLVGVPVCLIVGHYLEDWL